MVAKLLALFCIVTAVAYVAAGTDKERLVRHLMKGYIREVDPGNTVLAMGLSYVCADLNKETLQLYSKLLEKYNWVDTRLRWNPEEFDGIEQFRYPAKMIWTPDVKLYTTQVESEIRDEVNAVIYSNGSIIWIPMVTYKTQCSAHDDEDASHKCKIQIGSWTYDAINLDLTLQDSGFDTFMYLDTCPYTISDANVNVESKIYPCCPDPYASLYLEFKVHPRN
jgi:hypothetical protein